MYTKSTQKVLNEKWANVHNNTTLKVVQKQVEC